MANSKLHLCDGWITKHEPESTGYYSRCADGNYHRLHGASDGLTDGFQGHNLELMLRRTGEWVGILPNRIMVSDIIRLQEITHKSIQEISMYDVVVHWNRALAQNPTWRTTFKAPVEDYDIPGTATRIYNSIEEIEEELRDISNDVYLVDDAAEKELREMFPPNVSDGMDKATTRRMKRLETENKYYKDKVRAYRQMYVGAGNKIKELNAEIVRLKQFEPITVDPKSVNDKTDITRRFATMDLM